MFYCIQPHAVKVYLLVVPSRPVVQLFAYKRISVFDVVVHQIVVIAFFIINNLVPAFAEIIKNLINPRIQTFRIIYTCEAGEIPLEVGIFVASAREAESGVRLDFYDFRDYFLDNLRIRIFGFSVSVC